MRRVVLVALIVCPGCECMFTEENLVGVGRALWPDRVTLGRTFGDIDGIDGRTGSYDEDAWYGELSWDVGGAKNVRVVETVAPGYAAPREWFDAPREDPEPVPVSKPLDLTIDKEGNALVTIPQGLVALAGTGLLALLIKLLRRHLGVPTTPEEEPTE